MGAWNPLEQCFFMFASMYTCIASDWKKEIKTSLGFISSEDDE